MGSDVEIVTMQPDLWVTLGGERFCDEGLAFHDSHSGNANLRAAVNGCTFSVFDDSIIDHTIEFGAERGLGIDIPPGSKPHNARKEIQAAISAGSKEVFKANSIEELASLAGIDSDNLSGDSRRIQ
jgi:hypothetical protein